MGAKRASRRVTRSGARQRAGSLRVRMYNVGFGDSFLISYLDGPTERRILVDCGSIAAAPGHTMESVVTDIIADATDADGRKRIDVVIATHRHRDHVDGFKSKRWAEVEVGEVWMPWTEDPHDPTATRIRNHQGLVAEALVKSLGIAGRSASEFDAVRDMAMNALRNEAAMHTLHEGFRGSPKRFFLSAGANGEPLKVDTPALPRVGVHVLGPSRDEAIIKDMDPPAGQSYLRLALAGRAANGNGGSLQPFRHIWRIRAKGNLRGQGELSQKDVDAIQALSDDSDEAMAATIDSAVNGTSLLLVLEIGQAKLLLPGDAQWGTWKMALDSAASRKLLKAATFVKIGHHGSHNATPKDFVEDCLHPGTPALISVKKVQRWPSIPRMPLLTRLGEKNIPFARSDETGALTRPFTRNGSKWVDASIPF